jgi:hypothetical protein
LLEEKANVNVKVDKGWTALGYASSNGHADVVQALLAAKADINVRAVGGSTALIAASQTDHSEVVRILLAAGADANAKTDTGQTALQLAMDKGYDNVVELLRGGGAITTEEVFGSMDSIEILPIIDARTDQTTSVNLEGLRKFAQKLLEKKHYTTNEADSPTPGARWIMLLTLKEYDTRGLTASVSGSICDTTGKGTQPPCGKLGSEFWSGSNSGQYTSALATSDGSANSVTASVLTDLTFKAFGLAKHEALTNAFVNLMNDIPKLPRKK